MTVGQPRWTRCPEDGHLHLLTADQAQAADGDGGHGRAVCDQLIPAAGLTLVVASAGTCLHCLTMATGTPTVSEQAQTQPAAGSSG